MRYSDWLDVSAEDGPAYVDGGVHVPVRPEEAEAWTRLLGRIRGLAEEEVRMLLSDSALGLTAEWLAERGECDWHDSDLEDELGIVGPVAEIARREFTRAMREEAARRAAGEEETAR